MIVRARRSLARWLRLARWAVWVVVGVQFVWGVYVSFQSMARREVGALRDACD